jgi:hypothetical protein
MKNFLLITFLAGCSITLSADTFDGIAARFGVKPGGVLPPAIAAAKSQSEKDIYNNLLYQVKEIVWNFAIIGQGNSTACSNYVTNFLQIVGTPIAQQLLGDLKNGTASYKL